MPLEPGTALGHYRIEAPLGAGGMGEVYRATDTRLDREVAVKILSSDLTDDTLRQRFDREAKLISGLNHPNICVLHDIGHQDGVDYLVMELLEGTTLTERLGRGCLSTREVVRYGSQIADALDKVHRSGIVHRDLKPGNIMLTREGVKVLDFGLAKGSGPVAGPFNASAVVTQPGASDEPLTGEGSILGTLQYMAPEQLEGRETDARADLFSLGAILYEMASGRRAFEGDSQASLIASIMTSEPPSLTELQPVSPPALDRLVNACLAKDPEDRIQSAHDLKLQLRWLGEGSSSQSVIPEAPVPPPARRPSARVPWLLVALMGLGLIALTALWAVGNRGPSVDPGVTRLSVRIPQDVRISPEPEDIAISPDGSMLVFVSSRVNGALYVRELDDLEPRELPGTDKGWQPFWSPDGRTIGYFVEGKMMRIPASGDLPPQPICDAPNGRGGTWSSSGDIVFAPKSLGPLSIVSASGGVPREITTVDSTQGEKGQRYPEFLPDDDHFLYVSILAEGLAETRVASREGGTPRTVHRGVGMANFVPPGYLLFDQDDLLYAVPFDPDRLEVAGVPRALKDLAGGERNYFRSGPVSASRNGTLVYHQDPLYSELRWYDRGGRHLDTIDLPDDVYSGFRISPDGERVVVTRRSPENETDLWMVDLNRGALSRLTTEPSRNGHAVWTPDGRGMAFQSRRNGKIGLYMRDQGGLGSDRLLAEPGPGFCLPQTWSRDGAILVFRDLGLGSSRNDIFLLHVETGRVESFLVTDDDDLNPSVSPNGAWVAYRSDKSGRFQIHLTRFPEKGVDYQVTTRGTGAPFGENEARPLWHPDSGALLYLDADGQSLMEVEIALGDPPVFGDPQLLFRIPPGTTTWHTVDAETFLLAVRKSTQGAVVVVSNWGESLGRD